MKSVKVLSIFLLLICVSFLFAGCSQVNYTTIKHSNGEITESVTCLLDYQALENRGYDIAEKKLAISATAIVTMEEKLGEYLTKINLKLNQAYLNKDDETIALYNKLKESITIYEPTWEDNILNCKINFKNSTSYYLFYNLTEANFKQTKTKHNLFTNKIYYTGNLGYSLNHSLYSILAVRLKNQFLKFGENDVSLSYTYLAPARRYHSNANYIKPCDEGYLHTWLVESGNFDKEIYFYLIIANRNAWYLLAIVISLIVCLVLLIVAVIKTVIKPKHTLIQTLINNNKE